MRYIALLFVGIAVLLVACGDDGEPSPTPAPSVSASPSPEPSPWSGSADQSETCRFHLNPDKPNDPAHLSVGVVGDYLCWEQSPGAAEYVVEFIYAYTNCGATRRTQEIAETHPAGVTWARLPESPFAGNPFLEQVLAAVEARDDQGQTIGEGFVALDIEVNLSKLCESPPPSPTIPIPILSDDGSPTPGAVTPGGAWSDCPAVVSADLAEGLHVLDAESCGLTRIAEAPDAYWMSWSPDGMYLAFLRHQGNVQPVNAPGAESDLFLVRADGLQALQLTDSPGIRETSPVWSPDGSKLAYGVVPASDPEGGEDLILHTIGNGSTATIAHDIRCPSYEWVPDGDQIILSAGCGFDEQYVALLDLDSRETSVISGVHSVLAVHPYGDLVAYSCDLNDPQILNRRGLCIGRLDGSELSSPITLAAFSSGDTESSMLSNPILAYNAMWAPDGSRLAILSSNHRALFLLPADGGPGSTVDDWLYPSVYWATNDVIITSSCKSSAVIPCGPYALTSYRLDTKETWEALIFNCGSAGGVWSPDGSQLAISTAQLAGCL